MNTFTKKTLFIIFLYGILFAAFLYYGYTPINNQYKKNKADHLEKKDTIVKNDEKIASLQKIANNPKDFDKIFTDVNNFMPDSLRVSDFMVQVEGLAKDTGVVIDSFSVEEQKQTITTKPTSEDSSATAKKTKVDTGTKFTMVFKTTYPTMLNLISRMETLARLNSISTINITSNGETMSVNFSGKIYYGK